MKVEEKLGEQRGLREVEDYKQQGMSENLLEVGYMPA